KRGHASRHPAQPVSLGACPRRYPYPPHTRRGGIGCQKMSLHPAVTTGLHTPPPGSLSSPSGLEPPLLTATLGLKVTGLVEGVVKESPPQVSGCCLSSGEFTALEGNQYHRVIGLGSRHLPLRGLDPDTCLSGGWIQTPASQGAGSRHLPLRGLDPDTHLSGGWIQTPASQGAGSRHLPVSGLDPNTYLSGGWIQTPTCQRAAQ
ncbi:hypothetical protein NHX12_010848, partial [Muraenolepis orangiensis]